MHRVLLGLVLISVAWPALLGCGAEVIPNTSVPDTPANREVIDFCEAYRHALEQRDVGALLAMASPRYYENGGTPQGDDDYDVVGLRDVLRRTLPRVQTVRYEFRYRRIEFEVDRVHVDYTYSGSYQVETGEGPRWFRRVADNRLEIERTGGEYRIVSGM
jgi:hypothetical protein